MSGVKYFNNIKGFPGDTTSQGKGLKPNDLDLNFYNLRADDIVDVRLDETKTKLILATNDGKEFVVGGFDPYRLLVDEDKRSFSLKTADGKEVGALTKITTDSTLNGEGTINSPLGLNFASKSGYYKPVEDIVDEIPSDVSVDKKRYVLHLEESIAGNLYSPEEIKAIQDYLTEIKSPWRIATAEDWSGLFAALDNCNGSGYESQLLPPVLKSRPPFWNGNDDYGFQMLPVGYVEDDRQMLGVTSFGAYDKDGTFWRYVFTDDNSSQQMSGSANGYYSIRFVKDNDYQNYEQIAGEGYRCITLPYLTEEESGLKIWTAENARVSELDGEEIGRSVVSDIVLDRYYLIEYDGYNNVWLKHPIDEGEYFYCTGKDMEYRVLFSESGETYYLGSVADLIRSSMLESSYADGYLTLRFDTTSGIQEIEIDLRSLIDIYYGDGVTIGESGKTFYVIQDVPGGSVSYTAFTEFSSTTINNLEEFSAKTTDALANLSAATVEIVNDLEDNIHTEISNLRDDLDTVNEDFQETKGEHAEKIATLEYIVATMGDLSGKSITEALEELKKEVKKDIGEDITTLSGNLESFSAQVRTDLEELKEEVRGDVSSQIEALSANVITLVEDTDTRIDVIEGEMSGLTENMQALSKEVKDKDYLIAYALNDMYTKVSITKSALHKCEKDIDILSINVEDLADNIDTMSAETDSRINDLEEKIGEEIEAKVDALEEKIDNKINPELEALQDNVEAVSGSIETLAEITATEIDNLKEIVSGISETTMEDVEEYINSRIVTAFTPDVSDAQLASAKLIYDTIAENEMNTAAELAGLEAGKQDVIEDLEEIRAKAGTAPALETRIDEVERGYILGDTFLQNQIDLVSSGSAIVIETKFEEIGQELDDLSERVESAETNIMIVAQEAGDAIDAVEQKAEEDLSNAVDEINNKFDNYYTKEDIGAGYSPTNTVAKSISTTQKVASMSLNQVYQRIQEIQNQLNELIDQLNYME